MLLACFLMESCVVGFMPFCFGSRYRGKDKLLGIVKLQLIDLEPETEKEIELRLQLSLDMLKIKDKKDRGTLTIKVLYHQFTKEEQDAAIEDLYGISHGRLLCSR